MQDFWVFGYGSLMWNPGFEHEERVHGVIEGWHRSLCIYSWVHRGTPARPGLVLGLDEGGTCEGVAFRVAPARIDATIAYLRAREQVTAVYREITAPVRLVGDDHRIVRALTYVADRTQPQYAGVLSVSECERFVRQGVGQSGANPDYIQATVAHMRETGIIDAQLFALAARLDPENAGIR